MLHVFKETICAEDMANPLNQLPASVAEYLLAIYLVPSAFFSQALWRLPAAAHSLDQEHHLGFSSKPVSRYFLTLTLTGELGRQHCVSGGKSGCGHGHTNTTAVAVCEPP